MIIKIKDTANGIIIGSRTKNQDQVIYPVNFNVISIRVNNPRKLVPNVEDFSNL